jgi:hypothetical protein
LNVKANRSAAFSQAPSDGDVAEWLRSGVQNRLFAVQVRGREPAQNRRYPARLRDADAFGHSGKGFLREAGPSAAADLQHEAQKMGVLIF